MTETLMQRLVDRFGAFKGILGQQDNLSAGDIGTIQAGIWRNDATSGG